jgi:Cysteine-rich CPXCG
VDGYVSVLEDVQKPCTWRLERYFYDMTDIDDGDWTEEEIDEEFPLGDGTAETEAIVNCPYCGEANEIALDPGSGEDQEYVEDCQVCCKPWLMYVKYGRDGAAEVEVYASDS